MEHLIIQFSPSAFYFALLMSQNLPLYPVLKHPHGYVSNFGLSLHGTVSTLKFIINKTGKSNSPEMLRIITKLP
jgi:hypothetical protein